MSWTKKVEEKNTEYKIRQGISSLAADIVKIVEDLI